MSGTSLDGLDLCLAGFCHDGSSWHYELVAADTIAYSPEMRNKLASCMELDASGFVAFDVEYGRFLGDAAKSFIDKHGVTPRFVASHGHTVFHQPWRGITRQIGSGAEIAAATCLTTVCDFRSLDLALGGQGAPLVPIGDQLLFAHHDYCLNLGGFANISTATNSGRLAYDICPVNIALNFITRKMGKEYDDGGSIASRGELLPGLLASLNELEFYRQKAPKSLGREWVETAIIPLLDTDTHNAADLLRTLVEHCAIQLSNSVKPGKSVLVTGGGAYNTFLIERFRHFSGAHIVIPNDITIQFKEALIFAFLGHLRMSGHVNTLKSVTGATCDSLGGCIYSSPAPCVLPNEPFYR